MRFKARELMSEKRILAAEADDDVAAARDDEEVPRAAAHSICGPTMCRPVPWKCVIWMSG